MMRVSALSVVAVAALLAQAPVPRKKSASNIPAAQFNACWDARKTGKSQEATACFLKLLDSKVPALQAEGFWGLGKYEDAKEQFEAALKLDDSNPQTLTRYGLLFLERFNRGEALKLFNQALKLEEMNAPALYASALLLSRGFDSKASEFATKAANADPSMYQAHELLARLALENSDEKKAIEEANKALAITPKALNALATLGVIDMLKNQPTTYFDKLLALNPNYGEGWYWAGHHFIMNRRYEEGIELFRKAAALQPDLWIAHEQLGINLMRLGKPEEARKSLELAYKNEHHTDEVVNSLRLMDSYVKFDRHIFEGGQVMLSKKEAPILQSYFEEEIRKARATYEKKYKMHLDAPLEVEVYPDHEDFAVRTMGMPGLGATGVSFGPVVAMDSPSARKPGQYHWGSTLWHELSHSYILVMSKFLVPRWFTEGISVHEETQASPEWGDGIDPSILIALKEKKFLPVEDLDGGFVRPKSPMQVGLSYFQAGQAIDMIVQDYGIDTVVAMVHSFAARKSTPEVIREHLKMEPKAFDEKLNAFLQKRFGRASESLKEWRTSTEAANKALKAKDWPTAISEATKAIDAYPQYAGEGSAYQALATAQLEKGDKNAARNALRGYAANAGRLPEPLKKLAELEEASGDKQAAVTALQRIIYIAPVGDEDLHKRLGSYYLDLKQPQRALPAFLAQLASKPVDPAGVYYNLARTYLALSRRPEAQDALFQALEVAPGFKPAQKLLLELESK